MLALSYWQLALLLWIAWLVGASFGLFWAGRRRSRMDYQTAMNIVWSTHCPDKKAADAVSPDAPYKLEPGAR